MKVEIAYNSRFNKPISMLRYSRSGWLTPDSVTRRIPSRRLNWEFYAVLEGQCAPTFTLRDKPTLKENWLWLMSPSLNYGWTGSSNGWNRTLFHFAFIPDSLSAKLPESGMIGVPLTEEDKNVIVRLENSVQREMLEPTEISNLIFHRALIDLSLIVLQACPVKRITTLEDLAYQRVERAVAWYHDNMKAAPTIEAVAAAINISTSHLRRHFHQVKHCSPNEHFQKLRMERACKLLNQTTDTLDSIARSCGFPNSSDFCRAFKRAFATTPHTWRRRITTKNPFMKGAKISNYYPGDRRQDGHFLPKK